MLRNIAPLALFALATVASAQTTLPASEKDITYATSNDKPFKLDLYLPPKEARKADQKMPILLRFAPQRETPARPANELLAKGYALAYVSFLPEETPLAVTFNPFPTDLYAAKAAVRWARGNAARYDFDPDRIGVWGSGPGASLAALLAMSADQKDLAGDLGGFRNESAAVRAVCLFGGTTDWRNAELYGDENVNLPGSLAYQLFTGNPKDFPEATRRASAVTYIRPNSPAVLMVTLSSDSNRAMHLIFAETLHRAGVPSALYEEPPGSGAGLGGRAVDEAKLDRTILEFFADTLSGKTAPATLSVDEEITKLVDAGLYKQARRIIEEEVALAPKGAREPWLKRIREVSRKQNEKFAEAIMVYKKSHPGEPMPKLGREVLTDPEHIGEYNMVALPSQLEFDARANTLRHVESLNNFILEKDFAAADRQAAVMHNLAANRGSVGGVKVDPTLMNGFLARYNDVRAKQDQTWPSGVRPIPYALASGQDLYGFWFTMRAGGAIQRFRYIPAGKFTMGSARDEWARLPDEPILEPVEIKRAFWLSDAPVTQETWEGVMGKSENRSHFKGPKLPATNLSYAHAVNFLDKLGVDAKLPTAEQWEYACRAGSSDMYPVTGRLSDSSWFWDEAAAPAGTSPEIRMLTELETDRTSVPRSTQVVKQKLPNKWGLYDMQGNVWEWCAGTSPNKPREFHMAKGGSWISIPQSCRAARTTWFPIEQQTWNVGLRILIPAQNP
jgi:formylglycine-generating enzyme required for sulfatase activity